MCFSLMFLRLPYGMIYVGDMHGGTSVGTRCDCTSKKSTLASF
jgi:hypothetical protein